MKSILLSLTLCLCCSAPALAKHEYIFRYGHSQSAQHPRSQSMVFFKEELEKRTAGRIAVDLYFSSVLGTERELMDMVATNILQGTRGGLFVDANPMYSIFMLPFLMENWDQALRLLHSEFASEVNLGSRKNGFYIPATGISQGFRAHTNSVRAIRNPDDMMGLKMRVPQQEVYLKTAQAFGASPQEMPASEMYQAFRLGVIDGQDNPPANIWDYKLHEVQEFMSITNYATGPDPLIVSLSWHTSLPEDLQQIFDEVSRDAMSLSDQLGRSGDEANIEKLSQYLQINRVEGAELASFRSRIKPVYQYFVDKGHFSWIDIQRARCVAIVGDTATCPTTFIDAWLDDGALSTAAEESLR